MKRLILTAILMGGFQIFSMEDVELELGEIQYNSLPGGPQSTDEQPKVAHSRRDSRVPDDQSSSCPQICRRHPVVIMSCCCAFLCAGAIVAGSYLLICLNKTCDLWGSSGACVDPWGMPC